MIDLSLDYGNIAFSLSLETERSNLSQATPHKSVTR